MAEPHVCRINWQTADPEREYVEIANGGLFRAVLTGRKITDFTTTQQHVHIYTFPSYTDGTTIYLERFESAIVITGQGQSGWETDQNGRRWLLLYMNRAAPIWNNSGDVVYLREADGTFIDSETVGNPPRHPNGH